MFPWNYGFHWSPGTVIFLGAFYATVMAVAATIATAAIRARRAIAAARTDDIRWHSDFHDLPARDRVCRHVLTGEFAHRECPNAFDCRKCETHSKLLPLRPPRARSEAEAEILGMPFPPDRYYHRGHTWVKPEADGTVRVGIDELGRRLLGTPDGVESPHPGARLQLNGTAWRMRKRDAEVRVLSPVDGDVVEAGGVPGDWWLRVRPAGSQADLRHLLDSTEVKPWLLGEMERLQLALSAEGAPMLADGGIPVDDISANYPEGDWEAVCGEMFLQP